MNTNHTVYVKGKAIEFTSAFGTLAEAYWALRAQPNLSEFAHSLLLRATERLLSPLQVAWIHKLATDAVTPRAAAPVAAGLLLKPIVDMLATAFAAQKRRPRIVLAIGGRPVVLSMTKGGAAPGTVIVSDGNYGGRYFGRIGLDGGVTEGRDWTPEVEALLHRLAADPRAVAAQHGCATGQCCFCGRPLSTAESRTAGYGPVCAEKFGLAWGDTSAADAADAAAKKAGENLARDLRDEAYSAECEAQESLREEQR